MLDCGKDLEVCESSYDSEEDNGFNWGMDGTSSERVEDGPHPGRLTRRKLVGRRKVNAPEAIKRKIGSVSD